jgi:hypothetical protein
MPLHVAVDKHRPWLRLIENLIAAYPIACSTRDGLHSLSSLSLLCSSPLPSGGGRLPLHIVVDRNNPCIETVKLVIQAYPEGASTRRGVGRLPIHYAVFYDQPNLEVVKYLLEVDPSGAQTTDVYGRLPLHYAVDRSKPHLPVVKYLLSIFPNGAFVRDTNHRLPLMIAIDHLGPNESTAVVEMLLEINPNSIRERGPGGRFPLHVAVEVPKPNLSLVRYLTPLYPEALSAEITAGPPLSSSCPSHLSLLLLSQAKETPPSPSVRQTSLRLFSATCSSWSLTTTQPLFVSSIGKQDELQSSSPSLCPPLSWPPSNERLALLLKPQETLASSSLSTGRMRSKRTAPWIPCGWLGNLFNGSRGMSHWPLQITSTGCQSGRWSIAHMSTSRTCS